MQKLTPNQTKIFKRKKKRLEFVVKPSFSIPSPANGVVNHIWNVPFGFKIYVLMSQRIYNDLFMNS